MADIIRLFPPGSARDADAVLEQSMHQFSEVLIIGYNKQGEFEARATLGLSAEAIIFLLQTMQYNIISGQYEDDKS